MDALDTTRLLKAARAGDGRASDLLFPRVYDELRRLAAAQLRRGQGSETIGATGIVHEAYLRLIHAEAGAADGPTWEDRAHFVGVAAQAMRHILIDHARARAAAKRGGANRPVTLDPDRMGAAAPDDEAVLAVDAALVQLAGHDTALARLVELRFFGGLDVDEAAEALGVSARTAARMWTRAKAYLRVAMDAD